MNKIIPSVIEDNGEYYIYMEEYKKVKELEKYGWTYYTDKTCSYYGCCLKTDKQIDWFINSGKYISMFEKSNKSAYDLDTLYDLIKADLVEKVGEIE